MIPSTEPSHVSQEARLEQYLREHFRAWVEIPHGKFGVANSRVARVRRRVRDEGLRVDYKRLPNKPNGGVDGRYRLIEREALTSAEAK
jgi:hypothetical protein